MEALRWYSTLQGLYIEHQQQAKKVLNKELHEGIVYLAVGKRALVAGLERMIMCRKLAHKLGMVLRDHHPLFPKAFKKLSF
jgi:signal transduction histidine kinase